MKLSIVSKVKFSNLISRLHKMQNKSCINPQNLFNCILSVRWWHVQFNCWRRWGRTIYVISWRTSVIPRMPQIMVVCMRRIQKWLTKDGVDSLLECLMALWWALHSFIHHFFRTLFMCVYLDALDMLSTYLSFCTQTNNQ